MRYLHRHPKNGGYWFHRGIPQKLRPFFPGKSDMWRENLHTKDAAEARILLHSISQRVETLFQQAEQSLSASEAELEPRSLTSGELVRMVAAWKERELWRRAQLIVRGGYVKPGWSEFLEELRLTGDESAIPKVEEPEEFMKRVEAESAFIDRVIEGVLENETLLLPSDHPARQILWRLVREAWVNVLEKERRWRTNVLDDLPVDSPSEKAISEPRTPPIATVSVDGPLLSKALESWATGASVNSKTPARRTITEATTAVRRFKELHGDLPITAISKSHAREFRDAIANLPVIMTSDERSMTARALLASNLPGERPKPQTVNKNLNLMSGILSLANDDGYFDEVPHWSNPFRMQLRTDEADEESYEPFSEEELRSLVNSPVFAMGERPTSGRQDTAKWVPLVALLHGSRRSEVLQLFVRDVSRDTKTGIWTIDINRDAGKRVKNNESVRRFPIHSKLVELGFVDFVQSRQNSVGADASLWQGFEDRDKIESRMNNWSEWFHRYLETHVVKSRTKKFHSFRGTFKRFGRGEGCQIPDRVLDCICGHAPRTEGERYAREADSNGRRDKGYSLDRLSKELNRVQFPGVDFSIIK
jgi:integrase